MATIEPKRETIIKESFVLTYERAELEEIVANPKPWLREIKAVLDRSNQPPVKNWDEMTPLKRAKIGKKKKPQKVAAVVEATEGAFRCPRCKRTFKTQGWLNQHEAKVHDLGNIEIGTYQPERDEPAE